METILEILFNNSHNLTYGIAPVVGAAIISGVASLGSAIFGSSSANRRAKAAARERKRLSDELRVLEHNRQEIINPFEGVTDLSSMIQDLSGMASNPFQSLGVATKASEIQIEQSDIALANTLDALQASGASAGGATALAQAALKSKQDVAANIEQQEAQNEKIRLEGEQNLQRIKMSEALRVQGALLGEAGRMQEIEAKGKEFVYAETERRQTEQLNRIQAQITGAQQAQVAARQNQTAAISAGVTGLANVAGSFVESNYQGGYSQYKSSGTGDLSRKEWRKAGRPTG
tara:strand:+ start:47 stop:913 length:867 start_codon:yes stop_codon:yes gene_type:complete